MNLGFEEYEKLKDSLNVLYQNIPKYKINLENPKQKAIRGYSFLFKHMLIHINEGNLDKFYTLVKKDYRKIEKKKNYFWINIKRISISSILEYVIALSITLFISFIILMSLKIQLWVDLGSALSTIVLFFIIWGGIKKLLSIVLKSYFSKKKMEINKSY